jgi:hypothetical protein
VARVPSAAKSSLEQVLAWETDRHDLDPLGHHLYESPESSVRRWLPVIAGHRDAGQTACPGRYLYADLPAIRGAVARIVGSGKDEPDLTLTRPAVVHYPDHASITGSLTAGKSGIPGETIAIYARPQGGRWRSDATGTTQPDGSFDISVPADRLTRVRAVFSGSQSLWGAESHDVWIKVAPSVDVQAQGGTPDPTGARHYPNGTTHITFVGSLAPAHSKSYITVRVSQMDATGTFRPLTSKQVELQDGSSFTYDFGVPDPSTGGTFRITAWFPGDLDHLAARSDRVTVTVDPPPPV